MPTITDFTEQPGMPEIMARVEVLKNEDKAFSDVTDAEGHQYVDLVQEGGGVLGIALVGYTYVLEQAGIRFFSLAGTSAGAINTLMLASLGRIPDSKSAKILDLLVNKNLFDFVDGEPSIKSLLQGFIDGKPNWWLWMKVAGNIRKIISLINSKLGINPGLDFEGWIRENLTKNEINTTEDLLEYRKFVPALTCRDGRSTDDLKPKLVMITSDVTTQTKVQFPEMAPLYWKEPDMVHPSVYLRASMSIPIFFFPVIADDIPNDEEARARWLEMVRFRGEIPKKVAFVDGGLLSNFPINVFHNPKIVPRLPTFGVRLSSFRDESNKTDNFLQFAGAMIGTMRHIYDFDFFLRNPDYQYIIGSIDADSQYNWLDFNMPDEKKLSLFLLGASKAIDFLEGFNWEEYKVIRRKLLQGSVDA
ncbi:MAG: patatin-like phospholipase family protein [Bacteroidales bacterium]|nr:patatin-like phospholipase family protein [Bacteroidales bacterium]